MQPNVHGDEYSRAQKEIWGSLAGKQSVKQCSGITDQFSETEDDLPVDLLSILKYFHSV